MRRGLENIQAIAIGSKLVTLRRQPDVGDVRVGVELGRQVPSRRVMRTDGHSRLSASETSSRCSGGHRGPQPHQRSEHPEPINTGVCRNMVNGIHLRPKRHLLAHYRRTAPIGHYQYYGQLPVRDQIPVNPGPRTRVVSVIAEGQLLALDRHVTPTEQNWVGTTVFGSHKWPWLHRIMRTLLAAAAFIAMVVLVLGGPANARGVGPALGIRWIAFSVAVGASLILLRMGRIPRNRPDRTWIIRRVPSTSPTPQEIEAARVRVSLKYSHEVLILFSRILRDPAQYTTRAVEDVEVREGCLSLRTVMEYAFNGGLVETIRRSEKQVVLLPLIKLSKAATLDNLDVLDSDGMHVSPLLQDELYGLLAYVIENLFRTAYINSPDENTPREPRPIEASILQSLIQVACNPERINRRDISAIIGVLDSAGRGTVDPISEAAACYLRNLCEFFAENYIIAVEADLPKGNRLSMKYSRTVPLYERTAVRADRMRVRLGLSPQSFTMPLTLPFEAPSYHFSLTGVAGNFVASQTLLAAGSRTPIMPEDLRSGQVQPFLSSKCESALPYAHFHTRGLQRIATRDIWTRVDFDEVPPGALGGALVVSAACAILIWFFTLVQPGLRISEASSDLPAVLLTVPAFVATWIGNSVDRIQRSSISTYIGLGVSIAVSLGSAVLYIANASHKAFLSVGKVTFYHGLVRLNNVDATWMLLALIASVMSAYLAETLRDKIRGYMRLLRNDNLPRGGRGHV